MYARVPAIGVLLDERLPRRAPLRCFVERVHAGGSDRPPIRIHEQVSAADEINVRVIEVVGGEIVDGHALRGKAVPVVEILGEQRLHAAACRVRHVVPAHLASIVREAIWKRLRLRQQQRPHVFIRVGREQHHAGGLKILLAALQIRHARDTPVAVDVHLGDVRFGDDGKIAGFLCFRNGRDGGRAFRIDVTAAARAETVVRASGPIVVGPRVDRGRTGKRIPAERAGSRRHLLVPVAPPQRRHRVLAAARRLENVSASIDLSVDVACLARHTELALRDVVVALDLVDAERPVFHRRSGRDARGTVTFRGFADDLEVPRAQPPALRPVMKRRSANAVHHRMKRRARRIRRGGVRAVRRHFAVRFLHRLRPCAIVVSQFVWREILRREPRAGLEADHLESRLRKRQSRHAARGTHADDDDVGGFQVNGHGSLPWCSRTWRSRRPIDESALPARPSVDRRPSR